MAGHMANTLHALPFKKRKAPSLDAVPAKPVCSILCGVLCACARLCGSREVSTEIFLRQCFLTRELGQ